MTTSQDRLNSQGKSTIADYVGDIVAIETEIDEALDRQLTMGKDVPVYHAAIQQFHDAVKASRDAAKAYRDQIAAETEGGNTLIEKGASVMGAIAGMIDKIRTQGLAKNLRDDYVAFNTAAISYTMLHTTAMALGDHATEAFAATGLRTYARLVQEINNVIPDIVVNQLQSDNHILANPMAADQCRQEIDRIWKNAN